MRFKDLIIFSFVVFALINCSRRENGPPDSYGSEETNVVVNAQVILNTSSVDICNSADTGATANITVDVVNSGLPDNTLYLEKYSVEFSTQTTGAPLIEGGDYYESRSLPVTGLNVFFIDKGRKSAYLSASASGAADTFPLYTAKYTFIGKDKYGNGFGATAKSTFTIGKYGDCSAPPIIPTALSVSPSAISVTGNANPDNDLLDDIVFFISGGAPPYVAYSDNTSVIPAPGFIGNATSFSVDPGEVASNTTVNLTVSDSKGATVTAAITVTPSAVQNALSVSPQSVSLVGILNPDGNTTDDITLHISGGSAPYVAYSDNTSVIPAPGLIGNASSFTVDPDEVASNTTVTLTVSDSKGAVVTAALTVTSSAIQNALSVSPQSVSLVGLSNPDGNTIDDVTFNIAGGIAPYTVYSDNPAIDSPGALGAGIDTFTIDPQSVASETTATLTVLDAVGQTATATVNLK